jgi:hypothetical protein
VLDAGHRFPAAIARPPRLRYNAPMTEAEFLTFIAETRATVDAELARLESVR